MKMINDDGVVVHECLDTDGILVFNKDGIVGVLPSFEDDEEVPQHVGLAAATMVFVGEREGHDTILDFWEEKRRLGRH